jgi:hypothetical protein
MLSPFQVLRAIAVNRGRALGMPDLLGYMPCNGAVVVPLFGANAWVFVR